MVMQSFLTVLAVINCILIHAVDRYTEQDSPTDIEYVPTKTRITVYPSSSPTTPKPSSVQKKTNTSIESEGIKPTASRGQSEKRYPIEEKSEDSNQIAVPYRPAIYDGSDEAKLPCLTLLACVALFLFIIG